MSTNIFRRLLELLPSEPVLVGSISAAHADGTATVQLPGGALLRVRNPLAQPLGAAVYLQGGAVIGDAPQLPVIEMEIGA